MNKKILATILMILIVLPIVMISGCVEKEEDYSEYPLLDNENEESSIIYFMQEHFENKIDESIREDYVIEILIEEIKIIGENEMYVYVVDKTRPKEAELPSFMTGYKITLQKTENSNWVIKSEEMVE